MIMVLLSLCVVSSVLLDLLVFSQEKGLSQIDDQLTRSSSAAAAGTKTCILKAVIYVFRAVY
jgi:hypothetical protein